MYGDAADDDDDVDDWLLMLIIFNLRWKPMRIHKHYFFGGDVNRYKNVKRYSVSSKTSAKMTKHI